MTGIPRKLSAFPNGWMVKDERSAQGSQISLLNPASKVVKTFDVHTPEAKSKIYSNLIYEAMMHG